MTTNKGSIHRRPQRNQSLLLTGEFAETDVGACTARTVGADSIALGGPRSGWGKLKALASAATCSNAPANLAVGSRSVARKNHVSNGSGSLTPTRAARTLAGSALPRSRA